MPRTGSSTTFAALAGGNMHPAIFVSIAFADQTLYLWSGLGNFSWNGQTWIGCGTLGKISTIEQGSNVEARGITLTLSGVPSALVGEVIENARINVPVCVYLGALTTAGALVDNPVLIFCGYADQPTITDGIEHEDLGMTCTVEMAVEDVLVDLNRNVWRRYTNDDQQMDYPNDTAFQYVPGLQEITTYWGRVPNSWNR